MTFFNVPVHMVVQELADQQEVAYNSFVQMLYN